MVGGGRMELVSLKIVINRRCHVLVIKYFYCPRRNEFESRPQFVCALF